MKLRCACGKCTAELSKQESRVSGPFYLLKDGNMHWLICTRCDDRFKIYPVDYAAEV